jgi:asparagine synthase (glutamine-hydrolysing)
MCGITGIYAPSGLVDIDKRVAEMNAALVHRGPDDSGQYADSRCSLAMKRLSIIDLASGRQPMTNEDGSLVIVFNGEIYNFMDLRQQLEKSGHIFKTSSDTEVILHAYEQYGSAMPALLKGMFAFCIYDIRKRALFLARDRFGEKPLFYWQSGDMLAMSSELASLLAFPGIPRRLDVEALYYYLRRGIVPSPLTLFAGVRQLPPGSWMLFNNGIATIKEYFVPSYEIEPSFEDEHTAVEAVREALLAAVKRQMISDVPLGAFLSGGIDSSSIVAAMQRQSAKPIKTFTVRFEYAPYDESPIARRVAEHLGTDHHELFISNGGFDVEDLWRVVHHVGMPFADSSAIPTYHVCRKMREHVTVCLSGDGGDEVFCGYKSVVWTQKIDSIACHTPPSVLRAAQYCLSRARSIPGFRSLDIVREARHAVEIAQLSDADRACAVGMMFDWNEIDRLVSPDVTRRWQSELQNGFGDLIAAANPYSRLRQLMHFRSHVILPEDMLMKVDRMSMAASLEVRAPMLDPDLSSIAAHLPDRLLINRGVTKRILREAVRPWLPKEVFNHPKQGFSIPLHKYQNAQYESLCRELILSDDSPLYPLMRPEALRSIIENGLTSNNNPADVSEYRATKHVWSLLQLAAWARHFGVAFS